VQGVETLARLLSRPRVPDSIGANGIMAHMVRSHEVYSPEWIRRIETLETRLVGARGLGSSIRPLIEVLPVHLGQRSESIDVWPSTGTTAPALLRLDSAAARTRLAPLPAALRDELNFLLEAQALRDLQTRVVLDSALRDISPSVQSIERRIRAMTRLAEAIESRSAHGQTIVSHLEKTTARVGHFTPVTPNETEFLLDLERGNHQTPTVRADGRTGGQTYRLRPIEDSGAFFPEHINEQYSIVRATDHDFTVTPPDAPNITPSWFIRYRINPDMRAEIVVNHEARYMQLGLLSRQPLTTADNQYRLMIALEAARRDARWQLFTPTAAQQRRPWRSRPFGVRFQLTHGEHYLVLSTRTDNQMVRFVGRFLTYMARTAP
jgi:hypothetical protein